jgi:hypothetical protein
VDLEQPLREGWRRERLELVDPKEVIRRRTAARLLVTLSAATSQISQVQEPPQVRVAH